MITSSRYSIEAQYREECTYPTLGELLPDYVVELLEDSASAEVEDHLLDCLHCRETYLLMLSVEGPRCRDETGRGIEAATAPKAAPAPSTANVISMADFKRRRR